MKDQYLTFAQYLYVNTSFFLFIFWGHNISVWTFIIKLRFCISFVMIIYTASAWLRFTLEKVYSWCWILKICIKKVKNSNLILNWRLIWAFAFLTSFIKVLLGVHLEPMVNFILLTVVNVFDFFYFST